MSTWRADMRPLVRQAIQGLRRTQPDLTAEQMRVIVNGQCPIHWDWPIRVWRDETRRQLGLKQPEPPKPKPDPEPRQAHSGVGGGAVMTSTEMPAEQPDVVWAYYVGDKPLVKLDNGLYGPPEDTDVWDCSGGREDTIRDARSWYGSGTYTLFSSRHPGPAAAEQVTALAESLAATYVDTDEDTETAILCYDRAADQEWDVLAGVPEGWSWQAECPLDACVEWDVEEALEAAVAPLVGTPDESVLRAAIQPVVERLVRDAMYILTGYSEVVEIGVPA